MAPKAIKPTKAEKVEYASYCALMEAHGLVPRSQQDWTKLRKQAKERKKARAKSPTKK